MRSVGDRRFGQTTAIIAAVLISLPIALGSIEPTHAQLPDLGVLNKLKDLKKVPPAKAPVQVPRKGAVSVPGVPGVKNAVGIPNIPGARGPAGVPMGSGVVPNRLGAGPGGVAMPNGRMPGQGGLPNGLPNNARINPAIPGTRTGVPPGLNAGTGVSPGLNAKTGVPGLNAKAGMLPGLNAKGGTPPGLNAKAGTPPGLNAKAGSTPPGLNAKTGGAPGLNAKAGAAPGLTKTGAVNPNAKGVGANLPGAKGQNLPNTKSANIGPANSRFGNNRPGASALGNNRAQPRGFTNRDPRMRAVNAATPQLRQVQRFTHRTELFAARRLMPALPLPGERNFTGVPPVGETRYVSTELVFQAGPNMSQQQITDLARRNNLTVIATEQSSLTGGTLIQFRVAGGRGVSDVVRALESERAGIAQPNYVYVLNEEAATAEDPAAEPAAAESNSAESEQYVANKLRLAEVHKIATGKDVLIAVIDSQVDNAHPELAEAIAEKFDAVGQPDKPHTHGTGMTGAIVSRGRLLGIAPGAKALAVHAFSTSGQQQSPQATTRHIVAGLEWAMAKGARIINMSFAGPRDPMLALAMKKASEKGAILIAAVGNQGPKSPPLYPAADPHVIGVTAVDENDKLYKGANRGAQVAVASPGVDVMVAAPAEAYQLTTGTSVAAAHVSGVVALMLEKHPEIDATTVLEVLTASATRLGANKRNEELGWGLIDPLAALTELEARLADVKVAGNTPAPTAKPATPAVARTPPMAPAAAAAKPALPRPGLYVPKQ